MHPIRQSGVCQEVEVRRNSKASAVLSGVHTQMEIAELRNKHLPWTSQSAVRTWCLAAVLCLIASITIVCTTLWATSLVGYSSVSSYHKKINNSELYDENLMKQYIAKRYPELGNLEMQKQVPVPPSNTNKTTFQKQQLVSQEDHTKLERKLDIEKDKVLIEPNREVKTLEEHVIAINHLTQNEILSSIQDIQTNNMTTSEDAPGLVTPLSKQEFTNYVTNDTEEQIKDEGSPLFTSLKELFGDQSPGQLQFPDYGPDSYFYSEYDASSYYSNYDERTWTGYILEKIQELHDWLTTDYKNKGKKLKSDTIPQILEALNITLLQGDLSVLILKLKDLYMESVQAKMNHTVETHARNILTNTSSATSLSLLTLDILLLRNLHLMMWDNQRTAMQEVLKDSEIFAMNALFMQPDEVRHIYETLQKVQSKGRDADGWSAMDQSMSPLKDKLTSHFYSTTTLGYDVIDFTFSIIRAVANLGKAFRVSRLQKAKFQTSKTFQPQANIESVDDSKATELDCIWTIYCRNLDKTTKNSGIYGFLAKLNSIGLRLVAGEIRTDRLIDVLLQETFKGPKPINCDGIFPKCSNKNAAKIVLEGIIGVNVNGRNPNQKTKY